MIWQSHSWAYIWREHWLKKKYMYLSDHSSAIYNNQEMEAT